jgi:hypothetical protein
VSEAAKPVQKKKEIWRYRGDGEIDSNSSIIGVRMEFG